MGGDRAPGPDADARHPHGLFTTPSLLRPIFTSMRTYAATVLQPVSASVLAMSSGRLGAFVAVVIGLTGIVIGGRALARSAGRPRAAGGDGTGGASPVVAMVLGLSGLTLGGLVAATSDGGVGTGNGLAGAVVAMVLGLIGVLLGGLARARARQVA